MSKWKDEWQTLWLSDDEWLRVRPDGSEPTLEVAMETGNVEDEDGSEQRMFHVHRFDIERFKLVTDPEDYRKVYLVSEGYQPSWPHPLAAYEEWFASHLEDVARSCSEDPLELAKQFTDPDPRVRAQAYRDVGGYHGFDNFDSYPLELTETQLDARWGR